MTRFLSTCSAVALLLAAGAAQAQMSPAPNATAPANPAAAGTAMQQGTAPAPMAAPMPAAAPAKPMKRAHRAAAAKPMKRAPHGKAMPASARGRTSGDAAVDALNDQSLTRARNGQ